MNTAAISNAEAGLDNAHKEPVVKILCFGASDSRGGAGLMADIRQAQALGVQAVTVQLAASAQSQQGALALELLSLGMLEAQWQAALDDGLPEVLRLGWLPADKQRLEWLLKKLEHYGGTVLWDPVLSASQGGALTQHWQQVLPELRQLLVKVQLITPNLAEARQLLSWLTNTSLAYWQDCNAPLCATLLQSQGAQHVLITGGDSHTDSPWVDSYFQASDSAALLFKFYLRQGRLNQNVHGTGCHLLAALACRLAQGQALYNALVQAHALVRAAMRQQYQGQAWAQPLAALIREDWPVVIPLSLYQGEGKTDGSDKTAATQQALVFKTLAQDLGLYVLVDELEHLQALLTLGVDTLQWRVKNRTGDYLSNMQQAISLCQQAQVPLFINDDWQNAIALGAFGVHLGQEDLAQADLTAIAQAGLALGISTHNDWELARARAINPSYIALGPVYIPLSKQLNYRPLGTEQVAYWCRTFAPKPGVLPYRFTCIGGITAANIAEVMATGVGSAAIVTELKAGTDLAERFSQVRREMAR